MYQIWRLCAYMHFKDCTHRSRTYSDPQELITFAMKMYQNSNSGPRMVGLWMIFFFFLVVYSSFKYSLTKYLLSPKQVQGPVSRC